MGRGRAKAKQQKVARELKYNSHFTDLDALQRELGGSTEPAEGHRRRRVGRGRRRRLGDCTSLTRAPGHKRSLVHLGNAL